MRISCSVVALVLACSQTMRLSPDDPAMIAQGKDIFRFDTFGDETFWTDTLRMHEVIRRAVDPTTALSVGLKVDTDSLPPAVVAGDARGGRRATRAGTPGGAVRG